MIRNDSLLFRFISILTLLVYRRLGDFTSLVSLFIFILIIVSHFKPLLLIVLYIVIGGVLTSETLTSLINGGLFR